MKFLVLLSLVFIIAISSCKKDTVSNNINAEIISFNSDKCMCCWGWTIKIGNDTIKSDNIIIGKLVGYEIKDPIKVYIDLGEIKATCSNYYTIKEIKKAE
jgi:hypothetical protein